MAQDRTVEGIIAEQMFRDGNGRKEIRRGVGVSHAVLRRLLLEAGLKLRSRGRPVRVDVDVERMRSLRRDGWSIYAIGKELGVSRGLVRSRLGE